MQRSTTKIHVTTQLLQEKFHERVDPRRSLVDTEVAYLRRKLGKDATPDKINEEVEKVRRVPWAELMSVFD